MDWHPAPEPPSEEDLQRQDEGAQRADLFVSYLARDEAEIAFLDALAVGHTIPTATRIAGLSRYKAQKFLDYCHKSLTEIYTPPHK